MTGQELHYFAGGNTARGFYPLYNSNLAGLRKIVTLKGGIARDRSDILKDYAEFCRKKGYSLECLHSPLDIDIWEGVICRDRKTAVVEDSLRLQGLRELGTIWHTIDLETFTVSLDAEKNHELMEALCSQINLAKEKAYRQLAEALRIHDEWEAIFIDNMDFDKADELSLEMVNRLFRNQDTKGKGKNYHRFLGAATFAGAVDFVPNLTADCERRYLIKGRPGSGKSTMLKKIAAHAEKNGFTTEVYHCGFDPQSIDMVIVREIGFAIFDSTAPHEYFPERDGDSVIDVYGRCIRKGTDEDYQADILHISGRYRSKMNDATSSLALAKLYSKELETLQNGVEVEACLRKLLVYLERE